MVIMQNIRQLEKSVPLKTKILLNAIAAIKSQKIVYN